MSTMQHPIHRSRAVSFQYLLSIALIISWYILSPSPRSQLKDDDETGGHPGSGSWFKGTSTTTLAERLPSWLKERAIDKLPLYSNKYNVSSGKLGEVINAVSAAQKFVSHHSQNKSSTGLVFDVVLIGSTNRMEYIQEQQRTWASKNNSVRTGLIATEINTDHTILKGGSCQELLNSCKVEEFSPQSENSTLPFTTNGNTEQLCLDRRIGLAIGASAIRYRKIANALALGIGSQSHANANVGHGRNNDGFVANSIISTLPDYLIIAFDTAFYNTGRFEECMVHGGDDVPFVYAPFTSWTDVDLSDNPPQDKHQSRFLYPTNQTGVVFNKPAIESWIRRITCFSGNHSSSTPIQIKYDSNTGGFQLEHHFCEWMSKITTSDAASQESDAFEAAIRETFKIPLSFQRDKAEKKYHERVYSSLYQPISLSDLFSIYSSTMHLLCKSSINIKRIPSGERMLGYLIDRFKISSGGLSRGVPDVKPSCKVAASNACNKDMLACANFSLHEKEVAV